MSRVLSNRSVDPRGTETGRMGQQAIARARVRPLIR